MYSSLVNSGIYKEYEEAKNKEKSDSFYKLLMAKNYIIEGNLERANYFLLKISDNDDRVIVLKDRYQSLIHFIEGKYEKSLALLEKPSLQERSNFKHVCLLKIMNKMALNKIDDLTDEKTKCLSLTGTYTKNEHLWINAILSLKEDPSIREKVENLLISDYMFTTKENIIIWLKHAIYTNTEKSILKQLEFLPNFAIESRKIRELIGLLYYRVGDIEKSLEYIKDLKTNNALNIKGNIELDKKDYQKAYEFFQSAYKRKEDSLNSILISIPLSYITQNWQKGSELLGSLPKEKPEVARKLALDTIFKIRMKDFDTAERQLRILEDYYQGDIPFNIVLMYSYVSLIKNDKLPLRKYTHKACTKFDGINCWLKLQIQSWEDFSAILKNKELQTISHDIDIEKLKSKQQVEGLLENPVVDQKDIQELDSLDVIKKAAQFSY